MADEPNQPATGTEPPALPAEPAPAAPEPATGDPAQPQSQPSATDGTADEAAKWKALARKHEEQNKATRTELATVQAALEADRQTRAQQMEAFAKVLGLKPEEMTPEQIMAERDQARATADANAASARASAVELAVFRAAAQSGANGNALLDSRSFVATLSGLDPAAADFGQSVGDAIARAVEANPGWKTAAPAAAAAPPPLAAPPAPPAVPVPARSGGEHTAPGGNRQWTLADIQAVGKRDPQAVTDAMNAGLLIDLGAPPPAKLRR